MNTTTEEEKKAERRARKNARAAIYRARTSQDPERVAKTKAYMADWYAQRRQDPEWVAEQAAKREQSRQDPEWVADQKVYMAAYHRRRKTDPDWRAKQEEKKTDPEWLTKKKSYEREWKKNNPGRWKEIQRKHVERYQQTDPIKYLIGRIKINAKRKGIEFNLDPSDFTMPKLCPVLGIPIVPFKGKFEPGAASFDRIDPHKGYVKGNVNIISWRANMLKRDCTDPTELRAVADYIEQTLAKQRT